MNKPAVLFRTTGFFRLVVRRPDGSVRIDTDWFPNLILDAGLNRMGTGNYASHCQVGSGTTDPLVTDTALESYVASTSTVHAIVTGAQATPPYFGWRRITYRFAQGVAAGNLSEVGVGWTFATGSLFSRSRIKDEFGVPTTITVLGDEYLDVLYELRSYAPAADSDPFVVDISGTSHTCVIRGSMVTDLLYWAPELAQVSFRIVGSTPVQIAYEGPMGTQTQSPSGQSDVRTSVVAAAYGNNNLYRDFDTIWELDEGNFPAGIQSVQWASTLGTFQISFSPVINKTLAKVLHLNFRVAWARYVP